jgi:hypothetical protein
MRAPFLLGFCWVWISALRILRSENVCVLYGGQADQDDATRHTIRHGTTA